VLEGDTAAATLQQEGSIERGECARDRRITRRGVAWTSVDLVVVAMNVLDVDALAVPRGLVADRLLTENFIGR